MPRIILLIILFVLFIASFVSSVLLVSAPVASVKSVEFPGEKRIYFGPLLDNDTTILNFEFRNFKPENPLVFYHKYPTFLINSDPDSDKEHFFTMPQALSPFTLDANDSVESISIKFSTIIDEVPTSSYSKKEARLILGLVTPADTTINVVADTFYLIGKKTNLFIDWYNDVVNFDTVLLNRENPIILECKAKNTTKYEIDALNQELNLISQKVNDGEFFIKPPKEYPIKFYVGNNFVYRSWEFSYKPLDILPDTAEVFLFFQPFPEFPDKIDTAKVKLVATGANHSLDIIKIINCDDVNIDTIDVGRVVVGKTKTAKVILRNSGNINYGLVSQNIFADMSDEPVNYFQIESPFLLDEEENNNGIKQLLAGDEAAFEITFQPDRKGDLIARYILENDFSSRKIRSSSLADYKKTFILRGTGIIPTLTLHFDSLDFGNVNYPNSSANCPTTKDTIIQISNTGNATLIISNIYTDNTNFISEVSDLEIPAGAMKSLKIKFLATYPEKTTNANLFFETNEIPAKTSKIALVGTSIPPVEADLFIQHFKNKPGTILHVPVMLTNSNEISLNKYIKTYSFDVSFNPSLLEFLNFSKIGTASAGCDVNITATNNAIKINAGGLYNEFSDNDILLILNFKTFLGNSDSSELAFQNAIVGNGNCDDFMKLNVKNGSYSIDSICGLGAKLQISPIGSFKFDASFDANTSNSDINIEFTVPYQIPSNIELLNSFGERVLAEEYPALTGTWQKKINAASFSAGVYFCKFTAGIYWQVVPIIISK